MNDDARNHEREDTSGSSGQIGPNCLTQLTAQEDIIEISHTFNGSSCYSEDNLMYFIIVKIFVDRRVCSR
jgi:hypothetical protein